MGMSVENGICLELLISGYIREKQDELKLYMNFPNEIAKIMHDFYPLLLNLGILKRIYLKSMKMEQS